MKSDQEESARSARRASERLRQAPVLESDKPRHYPQVGRGHPELHRVDAALGAAPDDAPGYSGGRSYQTRPSLIVSWAIRRRLAVMVLPSLSRSGKFPSRNFRRVHYGEA